MILRPGGVDRLLDASDPPPCSVPITPGGLTGCPVVSKDGPASTYRFYTFEPGWIGEPHPAPTQQFLALLSGAVEMETTDGTVRGFSPGDLVLLEDTSGRGHVTRNVGDGYAMFLVIPVPAE